MAPFDDGNLFQSIKKLKISYDQEGFVSIQNNNDQEHWSDVHGTRVGQMIAEVNLNSGEFLTSLSGFYTEGSHPVVQSLKLQSNIAVYGPYGGTNGKAFTAPGNGTIVGFHGNSGQFLNNIDAYFRVN